MAITMQAAAVGRTGQAAIDFARVMVFETVNPDMCSTLDASALCTTVDRGQIIGGLVDGPLAFDNAVRLEAARQQGLVSPAAGPADILTVPDLKAGNTPVGQLSSPAGTDVAGVVVGAIGQPKSLAAAIFDVDGVLLASPHERAWREALGGYADPARFTTAVYQAQVAGKPRLAGARAALEAMGVPDAERQAAAYAERKQARLEDLIHAGSVAAFPDALRFVQALRALGWPMAVASSSKNANAMLKPIRLADGSSLHDAFSVNVCGRDLRQGKPNPEIFLLAAAGLRISPAHCFVAEDAPAGIQAARNGGMAGLGVARLQDAAGLEAQQATLVVTSLDEVALDDLAGGRLSRVSA